MYLIAVNNWGTTIITETVYAGDTVFEVQDTSGLPTLGDGEFIKITVSNGSALEIMHVTAINGEDLTVQRAQEGTTALVFSAGDVLECRPTAGIFDWIYQKYGRIVQHGTQPGVDDDDAIATLQSPAGAGNLTLTASPYIIPSVPRKVSLTSSSNCSGVTFTFTYKDENGDNQTSSSIAGPNATTIETDFYVTEISQIAVSGACTGIKVGIISGLITLDLNDGDTHKLTLDNNVEIRFANIPDNVESTMKLTLVAGGDHIITWDATFKTEYGIDFPTLSSNDDLLGFIFQGSSTIYVFQIGANMS